MPFQKHLLTGVRIRPVAGSATRHAAQAEHPPFCLSPPSSASISYQSTCPSCPHPYDCSTRVSRLPDHLQLFLRTYFRTVVAAISISGFSIRSRS
jgi:hypothetical protein